MLFSSFPPRQLVNYAYRHNIASVYPEPKDKEAFVMSHIYSPDYDSFTLDTYTWPQDAMNVQDVWQCRPLVKTRPAAAESILAFLLCFFYLYVVFFFKVCFLHCR